MSHPWEKHYPEGVVWDASIHQGDLVEMFRGSVAKYGPRVALEYRGVEITYARLGAEVSRFADALRRAGVGPGDTLAIYLANSPVHPFSFFGGLTAGARLAHLSPLDAKRELAHKVSDSGARVLVTLNLPQMVENAVWLLEEGLIDRLIVADDGDFGPSPIPLAPIPEAATSYAEFVAGADEAVRYDPVPTDTVALLQYTGGTTGMPKGCMLTHGNLTAALSIYQAWYEYDDPPEEADVVVLVLPLFHIYALTVVLLRGISNGATLLVRMRFDAGQILDDIERRRVTIFRGVPTMWIAIANYPGIETRDLSSLRICGSGGAPLPVEVGRRFEKLTGLPLRGGWGMTETAPAGTNIPSTYTPARGATIGVPLPGILMDIASMEDPSKTLPPGEVGEIRIKGPNVTPGYWMKPEATAESFVDGWFLTGDIGYMDADGYFYIVDRKKDLILSGGFNVYPQMIEQMIYEHPAVGECIVIGVPDEYRGEAAKAFVTLREGAAPFTLEELREFLKDRLGRHELPQHLEFRDALPRTSVGKLSRKELRAEELGKG
jgi:long-chain acyl-CoA synthetase